MIAYYRQNAIMGSITIAFRLGTINTQVSEFVSASRTSIPWRELELQYHV
jgi:hypothetical protein